jgi:LuxR family maltose regulon positive regulatory protein
VARDWFAREQRARQEDQRATSTGPERLTGRELAVLALLPTPLSQRELAGSLFVSPNTLKTHLRAVYRKLGVDSRDEAVVRARSLGLL